MNIELKKIEEYSAPAEDFLTRKIIQGENSLVLDALLDEYKGSVRSIYIDPPYNNGESYTHYDDTYHLEWLDRLVKRLEKLKLFLTNTGSIWISIDDNEVHYLKVAADSVFGRNNFVTTIIWQQRTTRENRKIFSNNHEYILVYARDKAKFSKSINRLPVTQELIKRYKNPDNDPRGLWQSVSANVQAGHAVKSQFYTIKSPTGKMHTPPNGRCWAFNEQRMLSEIRNNNIWFGKDGNGVPRVKKFLSESTVGVTPETLWLGTDVGTNKEAKKHLLKLFPDKEVFDTPKPEKLIKRIFDISTNPGDLILDAYLGSGASIAVAHKMGRQYIGIDMGNHIVDYAVRRQRLVLQGDDGGISEEAGWSGGGGFDFYVLKAEV
jgi:adenine-specific DNA-methyltransferase